MSNTQMFYMPWQCQSAMLPDGIFQDLVNRQEYKNGTLVSLIENRSQSGRYLKELVDRIAEDGMHGYYKAELRPPICKYVQSTYDHCDPNSVPTVINYQSAPNSPITVTFDFTHDSINQHFNRIQTPVFELTKEQLTSICTSDGKASADKVRQYIFNSLYDYIRLAYRNLDEELLKVFKNKAMDAPGTTLGAVDMLLYGTNNQPVYNANWRQGFNAFFENSGYSQMAEGLTYLTSGTLTTQVAHALSIQVAPNIAGQRIDLGGVNFSPNIEDKLDSLYNNGRYNILAYDPRYFHLFTYSNLSNNWTKKEQLSVERFKEVGNVQALQNLLNNTSLEKETKQGIIRDPFYGQNWDMYIIIERCKGNWTAKIYAEMFYKLQCFDDTLSCLKGLTNVYHFTACVPPAVSQCATTPIVTTLDCKCVIPPANYPCVTINNGDIITMAGTTTAGAFTVVKTWSGSSIKIESAYTFSMLLQYLFAGNADLGTPSFDYASGNINVCNGKWNVPSGDITISSPCLSAPLVFTIDECPVVGGLKVKAGRLSSDISPQELKEELTTKLIDTKKK